MFNRTPKAPNDKQIFKISLSKFDPHVSQFDFFMKRLEYINEDTDPNRRYIIDDITKEIVKAISEYTRFHKITDPISRDRNSNHLGFHNHDAPIEKALTKITVTENNTKKEYVDDELENKKKIGYSKYTQGFDWDTLMKAIYKKQKDTIVGENEATIEFELDMTTLKNLTPITGGRRRSSRKNYNKSAKRTKRHSRPKSRKSSSRK